MLVVRFLRDTPCASLLIAQLLGVLLYPFMEESVAGKSLLAVFGLVVLVLAVRAVRATPALWWVAVTLAAPALCLLVFQVVTDDDTLAPVSAGFEAALYFYAAVSMLRYMLHDSEVTQDELFAIGAAFTLVAWSFAYAYIVVQAIEPGSFTAAVDPQGQRSWTEILYLSFTTLSGVGLSDISPIKGHARSVVMLEQAAGIFYIAMVVTRLIGLKTMRKSRR